ncbi:3-carboxy-cis,cis-muconate cycloisomerase [Endobacter medicaginis]|uniref:3-carboxy-cis,cis-muconate cycloisomerase n=3 Tax=Endobacter medicaginis TaxID=1181271 RepID=A0A839V3B2_9PROT|nr:3-carboxy-cis,cis-muconate cycloisomerase [Endobacter medicaginis]MCX5475942.1 lyase family protein [Endobacter medicaginis]
MSHYLGMRPWATPAMRDVFSDEHVLRHALAFEAALARAQLAEELIDASAAQAIGTACDTLAPDPAELAEQAAFAGTLAIPLVTSLRQHLGDHPAARLVHLGATSQDLADTVLMCQVKAAHAVLLPDLERLCAALAGLAREHAACPAIGRTLLQDATAVGFGLRLAQALAGIDFAWAQLDAAIATHARLQLGGAAGSRAGLQGRGAAIAQRVAAALELAAGPPWHAQRVGVGAIASALGLLIGAVGKPARDIALLAQNAIGEAQEPRIAGRGGSSAMAHKRNPTGCQVALSAAIRAPGLVASVLGGLPQEQERGLGGWQAEAPVLAELFGLVSASLAAMAVVAGGLEVNQAAIAANLEASGLDAEIGESVAIVNALLASLRRS